MHDGVCQASSAKRPVSCRRGVSVALLLALSSIVLFATGCLYLGGDRSQGGWQMTPGSVSGDWRQLDMQELMAYSDTWFVVDSQQRGTIKGFATGATDVGADGGYFELSVISRRSGVPVQQTVRVYFDTWTPVYVGGSREDTVLEGLTTTKGYNVAGGGRMLDVPFHINGGQLDAERVNVLYDSAPRVR